MAAVLHADTGLGAKPFSAKYISHLKSQPVVCHYQAIRNFGSVKNHPVKILRPPSAVVAFSQNELHRTIVYKVLHVDINKET